ncbi:hypothetical protein [Kingella sp. (in: b-proteobacteria)]|nr:hypothetical protein [Kingella sp. (in: b-proteobacteria)]MDO4657695.1 hypothetical protein [Kingella sp. (in: b-proteobacteria)]
MTALNTAFRQPENTTPRNPPQSNNPPLFRLPHPPRQPEKPN